MTILAQNDQTWALDHDAMNTPAAQRARHTGLLAAKQQAMGSAARLAAWGYPLLIVVIVVSVIHVFESVAAYVPAYVAPLELPALLHYGAALALTVAVDLAALYAVAANGTAAYAGATRQHWHWWFLALTGLLNMAFFVSHAPNLPEWVRDAALPFLDLLATVMLPLFIPAAVAAVESARCRLEAARLALLVETTALSELVRVAHAADALDQAHDQAHEQPAPAAMPQPANDGTVKADTARDEWATVRLDQAVSSHHTNGHNGNGTAVSAKTETLVEVPPEEISERLRYTCERCGERLSLGQFGAMRRNGYCRHCKGREAPDGWR